MLKKMVNSARVDFDIIPIDPLLIKSGQATVGGVGMAFVRTYRNGDQEEPFIPGSSIKGMIRAYAEKICRSLKDKPVPVCLPYLNPKDKPQEGEENQCACGLRIGKKNLPASTLYRLSCPACRLFGTHGHIGRLATSDAYLTDAFRAKGNAIFEIRDGVAIDRLTGGTAPGAKFEMEILSRGEFCTTLEIRNFERWQLGMAALVLRDMEEGVMRIGFGKSRGLGRFKAVITNFQVSYYHQRPEGLVGVSALCSEDDRQRYGFFHESQSAPPVELPPSVTAGLRHDHDLTDSWKAALEPATSEFVRYIETVQWPQDIETFAKGGEHAGASG